MKSVLILKHKGKKKNFYSVHLMDRNEYIRIYGKFSSLIKANRRAKKVAQEFGGLEIRYAHR